MYVVLWICYCDFDEKYKFLFSIATANFQKYIQNVIYLN